MVERHAFLDLENFGYDPWDRSRQKELIPPGINNITKSQGGRTEFM